MSQITTAKIVEYDGCNMLIIPQEPISREMIRKQVKICVNTLLQIIAWIMTLSISAYPPKSLI